MDDDPAQQTPNELSQGPDATPESGTASTRRRVLQGAAGTGAGVFVSVLANRPAFAQQLTESCRQSVRPGASLGCRERNLRRTNNAGGNGVGKSGGTGPSGTD